MPWSLSYICLISVNYLCYICLIFVFNILYRCKILPQSPITLSALVEVGDIYYIDIYLFFSLIIVTFLSNFFIYCNLFVIYLCAEFDPDRAFGLNPLSQCTCGWSMLQSILTWMLIVTFMFSFVVYLFVVCWNHVFQLQKLYLSIAEIASFNWRNHILQLQISDLSIAEIISFNCRNHIFQLTNLYFLIAEIISFSWRACIF